MRLVHCIFAASLVLAAAAATTQETMAQEKMDTAPLPPICTKDTMAGMTAEAPAKGTDAPAGAMAMPMDDAHKELAAGMAKMQADMAVGMQASDPDIAFNCGMIPHHQGAISMARVELKYGKDPVNRKLAGQIIKEQEKEIGGMVAWLQKHSK
jgi:uncharacterized protein (DUF305 family)